LIYINKQLKYISKKYEYFGNINVQKTHEITVKASDSYCQTEHRRVGITGNEATSPTTQ
jgi:hypothetical protein